MSATIVLVPARLVLDVVSLLNLFFQLLTAMTPVPWLLSAYPLLSPLSLPTFLQRQFAHLECSLKEVIRQLEPEPHRASFLPRQHNLGRRYEDEFLIRIGRGASFEALKDCVLEPAAMDRPDELGATPLLWAGLKENWAFVRDVLECAENDDAGQPLIPREDRIKWTMTQYNSKRFQGENILHIAIVQHNAAMVKFILDFVGEEHQSALLEQHATGAFFRPGRQQWDVFGKPVELMARSPDPPRAPGSLEPSPPRIYYGGTALSFAVCTDQRDLVRTLVRVYHANVRVKDRFENTLLHFCVIHELPEMFDLIVKLAGGRIVEGSGLTQVSFCRTPLWEEENRVRRKYSSGPSEMCEPADGAEAVRMTPLVFAAELGSVRMFEHILNLGRVRQWKYGRFTSHFYPLKELLGEAGAVTVIVRNAHTNLIKHRVITRLLDEQWESGIRTIFEHKFTRALITNIIVTATSVLAVIKPEVLDWHWPTSTQDSLTRTVFAACNMYLASVALAKLRCEAQELAAKKKSYLSGSFTAVFENLCSSSFSFFLLALVMVRHSQWLCQAEGFIASVTLFLGWSYSLFFLLGWREETGVFLISVWRMLGYDVIVFMRVFVVFALAFGSSVFHLMDNKNPWDMIGHMEHAVENALGDFALEPYKASNFSLLAIALYMLYTILVPVLLFNVLMAKMTVTIQHISDSSKLIYHIERARIMGSLVDEEPEGWDGLLKQGKVRQFWSVLDLDKFLSASKRGVVDPEEESSREQKGVWMLEVVEDTEEEEETEKELKQEEKPVDEEGGESTDEGGG